MKSDEKKFDDLVAEYMKIVCHGEGSDDDIRTLMIVNELSKTRKMLEDKLDDINEAIRDTF